MPKGFQVILIRTLTGCYQPYICELKGKEVGRGGG
jgi:hypothetical protein